MTQKNQHAEMVRTLSVPGEKLLAQFNANDCHMLHMLIGIAGEVLELELALRDHDDPHDPAVIEELGDIEYFFAGLCQSFNVDPHIDVGAPGIGYLSAMRGALEALIDAVKRHLFYNQRSNINEVVMPALFEFRHQMLSYYRAHDLSQDDILLANGRKLRTRYGDKFTDEAAAARRDKA